MSDHFIKLQSMEELRQIMKLKTANEELLEYFASSLWWLIRYSEKYNIPLPEKDKIIQAVESAMKIAEDMPTPIGTTVDEHPDKEHYKVFGSIPSQGVPIWLLQFGWLRAF
jgi:hypothetical protein